MEYAALSILTIIVVALLVFIYALVRQHARDRRFLINALIANNAVDMANLHLTSPDDEPGLRLPTWTRRANSEEGEVVSPIGL